MSVLKVRDKNGKFVDIPAIVGPQGPAAYKAGAGINISEDNVISATGGGTGGASYVAGANISIEGNVISATIPEEYITETELSTTLETKADKETTYTKTETDNLVATKVDKTYVDTQLNLKANKSTTYTKSETNTAIEEYIADKADKSYVDTQLNTKANVSTTYTKEETAYLIDEVETSVNLTLGTKVNQGDVYTKSEIDEKLTGVITDAASVDYVDSNLALKADKETTYTKTEVDDLISTSNAVAGDTYPVGALAPFAGSTIPQNWLLCDGREVSRETYKELFAVIGTTYGSGDGSTSFNLPDSKDRAIFGVGNDISLGAIGGEKEHTLTVDEMPEHNHAFPIYSGTGSVTDGGNINKGDGVWKDNTHTTNRGGNQPHNNMPPYLGQTYIIKAKQSAGVVATVVDTLESSSTTDALSANQGRVLANKGLKKLWENSDTSNSFGRQDITLSSDDYDYLVWFYLEFKGNNGMLSTMSLKGWSTALEHAYDGQVSGTANYYNTNWYRKVERKGDRSFNINDCKGKRGTETDVVINNGYCLPVAVYGGKF